MTDERKLSLLAIVSTALVVLAVAYNIVSESFLPGIEGYIKRKAYYEGVISGKGLSKHKADYWRREP
jgi:hypothetical protein